MATILITGTAGFIGFHLAKKYLDQGDHVIGIDSVNDYYDQKLKHARNHILQHYDHYDFHHINLCDFEKTKDVIDSYLTQGGIDALFHLAAQPGVRYSIENPWAYINNNMTAFVNLCEIFKNKPDIPFYYASSSSVYGQQKKTPFSENDHVNQPVSLYAATKLCNEMMAYTYYDLYKIRFIGFRFFTVYGPWGRPDMATYGFTQKIMNNQAIDIYNHGKVSRDFTYIDDIIAGLHNCDRRYRIDHDIEWTLPKIYNLGNNTPESVDHYVTLLEKALGKKAVRHYIERQAGDVDQTFADINSASRDFGFLPKTKLDVGLRHFAKWYKEYHHL